MIFLKRFTFAIALFIFSSAISAQKVESFYDRTYDVHLVKSVPGWYGVGIQYSSSTAGLFKSTMEYQNLFLEDLVPGIADLFSPKEQKQRISNVLGSLSYGLNVYSTDKLIVSAGLNASDYYTYMIPVKVNNISLTKNPWFYTVGSFARADYALNEKFLLRVRNHISLYTVEDFDKQAPLFIKTGVELISIKGLFVGAEYVAMTNYFQSTTNSLNFRLGFRL